MWPWSMRSCLASWVLPKLRFEHPRDRCGSGQAREANTVVDGTGFARVRGQARSHTRQLSEIEQDSCSNMMTAWAAHAQSFWAGGFGGSGRNPGNGWSFGGPGTGIGGNKGAPGWLS